MRRATTLAATAVAIACLLIAGGAEWGSLLAALLVSSAGAILLKYRPLLAGIPPVVAVVASLPSGSAGAYLFPTMLFGVLGVLRHFKVLPGGWSEP
jgi:hypothetical protein